ncbi:MAG TPA: hypothetical protein DEG17_22340 [Cyanobacteria bacterium UBA11149]|nr:hypothetical protein [Cyanobacteria bacterium UBA11149]HCA97522.1 hypothetical protein [Cyanobacteria bacterium UBA9226]
MLVLCASILGSLVFYFLGNSAPYLYIDARVPRLRGEFLGGNVLILFGKMITLLHSPVELDWDLGGWKVRWEIVTVIRER